MPNDSRGLAKAKQVYQERSRRARQLRAEGSRVIGYPCVYVPVEMLSALGLVPYRTYGDIREPVTEADRALPTSFCPFMRSCFDCALKAKDDFLDGMVVAHSCDPQEKTARLWESYVGYPYFHFMDVPGTVRPEAVEYFGGQLSDLKATLEAFTGQELTVERLRSAIQFHNEQRALVKELYELTKPAPPLVSGTEMLQVVKALMSLPVAEGNDLLKEVIGEVQGRTTGGPELKPVRLLVWSSTLDDVAIMEILESGANVVMDEGCGGMRAYRGEVKLTDEPMDGLARHYMDDITCARTFRQGADGETTKEYSQDLEKRFGYLKDVVEEWSINAAILLLVRYCDPFAFEVPSLRDYFDAVGIPSIYIEYDYAEGALAPLRTRVEAFFETIG